MIEKFEVDFAAADPKHRQDMWADTVRPLGYVSPIDDDLTHLPQVARGWMLDRLVFCEGKFGPQINCRSKRDHASHVPDALVIQTYLSGSFVGEIADRPLKIKVGEVNVTDYSRGHRGVSERTHVRSLVVAHDLIGYDPSRHPATMRFGLETVVGRVLMQTLLAIHADLDATSAEDAPQIANGLIGLLRHILFKESSIVQDTQDFSIARARAIRAHIKAQNGKERLTVEKISRRFNVSRATLYRDFRDEGGVDSYILGCRLEASLMELASGPAKRGAVSRAADRWGFSSTAHFSRAFRRRFGFSPSDVVARRETMEKCRSADTAPGPGEAGETLERFLRGV